MKGWKTWAAGASGILSGIGMILKGLASEEFDWGDVQAGLALFVGGLGMIGLGHKLEKLLGPFMKR